jgi:hypothetical protein
MKCEVIERWVSDEADASLASKKRTELEAHLRACSSCRQYRSEVRRLQAESGRLEEPEVSPEHVEALSAAIMGKLGRERQGRAAERAIPWIWQWARLAVPAVLALAIGVVYFQGRAELPPDDILSLEGCFDRVAREISGDAELAAGFNRFITESLAERRDPSLPSEDVYIWNEPYFWESLSDEELRLIEEEVKKEISS